MKVSELIYELSKLDQDAEVIVSTDAEGNGYSPLSSINPGTIHPNDVGEYNIDTFYDDEHSDEECDLEEDDRKNFPKVVCLFP